MLQPATTLHPITCEGLPVCLIIYYVAVPVHGYHFNEKIQHSYTLNSCGVKFG